MAIIPVVRKSVPPYYPQKASYKPTHPSLFLIHFADKGDFNSSLVTQKVSWRALQFYRRTTRELWELGRSCSWEVEGPGEVRLLKLTCPNPASGGEWEL